MISPQPWQIPDLSLHQLLKIGDTHSNIDIDSHKHLRVVLFSDFSSQHLIGCLKSALFISGYSSEFFTPDSNKPYEEVLFSSDWLTFDPDIILVGFASQSLLDKLRTLSPIELSEKYRSEISSILAFLFEKTDVPVLHLNFSVPTNFTFGISGSISNTSTSSIAKSLNSELSDLAKRYPSLYVIDLDSVASFYGKRFFISEKMWVQSKQLIHPKFLPTLSKYILDVMLTTQGCQKKLLILDLDNTSWGGILSEDGYEGIEIGLSSPISHAFLRFQQSVKFLKERGLLLAICSKNNLDAVINVLDNHPEIHLLTSDFVSIKANYNDKVQNIIDIKNELDLGFDSIVFFDDSSFERNHVRSSLPDVVVPDLPADVSDFSDYIYSINLFESFILSEEDVNRTDLYQARSKRLDLLKSLSFDEYLYSLEMKLDVSPFNDFNLPRVHQLFQRSNQFNLTTKRYSINDLSSLSRTHQTFAGRLSDKFSDEGVVSCIIANVIDDNFFIDSWIMSCRVLGRRVEQAMFLSIVKCARKLGCINIIGEYVPTSKNSLVSNFYQSLDFTILDHQASQHSYCLNLESCDIVFDDTIEVTLS